jgi:simple sugar transport system ATP-binding protein
VEGALIRLDKVGRRCPDGRWAVRSASVRLEPGRIHAVIGENGAGKTTLFKMAAGALAPHAGVVEVGGAPLVPATPVEAARRGVGLVHQHFMLVGAFRAIENLVLGPEPTGRGGRLDLARAAGEARKLMERTGLHVDLEKITDELSVGERQRLEILRVLYRGARALLLDEPTAVLSPLEAEELYGVMRKLADEGTTVAVVTHRLDEVIRFADHVTVLRRGELVLSKPLEGMRGPGVRGQSPASPYRKAALEDELTSAIMGGAVPEEVTPPALSEDAKVVLEVRDLVLADAAGRRALDIAELSVRAGEIVGVAGIEGNGQRELVRALAGLEPRVQGSIRLRGEALTGGGTVAAVRARRAAIGVVHEDRHEDGLMLEASVGDNCVLGDLGALGDDEDQVIARRIQRFGVRPSDPSWRAAELSGGNQQKIVVARAIDRLLLSPSRALLVLGQPTRGVDVGAAATIHKGIGEAAARGLGVLLISADLGELRRLSHRILVLHRGRVVAELSPETPDDVIGRAMLGMEEA